jgi:hypothetical protein
MVNDDEGTDGGPAGVWCLAGNIKIAFFILVHLWFIFVFVFFVEPD